MRDRHFGGVNAPDPIARRPCGSPHMHARNDTRTKLPRAPNTSVKIKGSDDTYDDDKDAKKASPNKRRAIASILQLELSKRALCMGDVCTHFHAHPNTHSDRHTLAHIRTQNSHSHTLTHTRTSSTFSSEICTAWPSQGPRKAMRAFWGEINRKIYFTSGEREREVGSPLTLSMRHRRLSRKACTLRGTHTQTRTYARTNAHICTQTLFHSLILSPSPSGSVSLAVVRSFLPAHFIMSDVLNVDLTDDIKKQVFPALKKELVSLLGIDENDNNLFEYIVLLISNRRPKSHIANDLEVPALAVASSS